MWFSTTPPILKDLFYCNHFLSFLKITIYFCQLAKDNCRTIFDYNDLKENRNVNFPISSKELLAFKNDFKINQLWSIFNEDTFTRYKLQWDPESVLELKIFFEFASLLLKNYDFINYWYDLKHKVNTSFLI